MAQTDREMIDRIVTAWPTPLLWSLAFHLTWIRACERLFGAVSRLVQRAAALSGRSALR